MNEINKIAGSGTPLMFAGKEYVLSPLTVSDIGEIEIYAKSERIKTLLLVNPGLSLKEQIELIKAPLTPEEIDGVTSSVHGAIYTVWLSLRHAQKEVTMGQVNEMVNKDNLRDILGLIDSFSTPKNETAQTQAKTQAGKP